MHSLSLFKTQSKYHSPSGILSLSNSCDPINTPKIPLIIANALAVFASPPRFFAAGVANASVKLLTGNASARFAEMPMAWQMGGYPNREPIAILSVSMSLWGVILRAEDFL
jgi:hypothetical protein